MPVNNFKRLMEEDELHWRQLPPPRRNAVWENLSFFQLAGKLVDVYIPKVFDTFIHLLGGQSQDQERPSDWRTPPSQLGSDQPSRGPNDIGPTAPDL